MTATKVTAEQYQDMEKSSAKKMKKEQKRKLQDNESSQDDEKETVENTSEAPQEDDDDDDKSVEAAGEEQQKTGKEVRAARRKEREDLLNKVPKADEHGIAYTKQQLRRMKKRVARGLDPIETSKEIHERLRQDASLRREEEEELAGMMHVKEDKSKDAGGDGSDAEGEDVAEADKDEKGDSGIVELTGAESQQKKGRRAKVVPKDYVCQACKGLHQPTHWIYDCPDKVTVRGFNSKSKDLRGIKDPDHKRVFVSGLPFESKAKDVTEMFAPCGTISHCNLFTYDDTGRCKGQGIVTFETEEAADKALQLSGTVIGNAVAPKKKGEDASPEEKRKELKLKVTRVLNRTFTKKN